MSKLKKNIGLDARMWNHPGIGRYIRELSAAIVPLMGDELYSFIGKQSDIQNFFLTSGSPIKPRCIEARSKIYSLREQWEMPQKTIDLDLLHVPHFNIPLFLKKKLVVTVHDLIYLHEPRASRSRLGGAYTSWMLQSIEKKADAVITVSQYTKDDLIEHFPDLSPEQVVVIHEAPSALFRKISDLSVLEEPKKRFSISRPFVLFVGTLKPHKNIPILIEAMKVLRELRGIEHEVVIVGRKDERNESLLKLMSENNFVRYLGELSDEDLLLIYNLADLFVLPSFFEGFGLPAVEAMACGTPVLLSNRASLPELAPSKDILFDPLKVDALIELLYNAINNREFRKNMIDMGLEKLKKFSWQRAARETMQVYRQVMS